MMDFAASFGALGFWLFLAAIVVGGMWFDARKRETEQETLRRVVESGQQIDKAVLDKMLAASGGSSRVDRDFKSSGLIVLFIAPGIAALGWFLGQLEEKLFGVMIGVALLLVCVAAGLLVAGKVAERWYREDQG